MQTSQIIDLFVPGRVALLGEHSDWAAGHRKSNNQIPKGAAIVVGTNQGVHAQAHKLEERVFTIHSLGQSFSCPLDLTKLLEHCKEGFFSYTAGVVAYLLQNYHIGGININVTKVTLPLKKGLSSSAAICILVVRAFNNIYNLNLSTREECEIAYKGETLTPSKCGRLDHPGCAYPMPVHLIFDGDELHVDPIQIKEDIYLVFADLQAEKNTMKILEDLNKSYPFPQDEKDTNIHSALGEENLAIISLAKKALEEGSIESLGKLFEKAQSLFDDKVAPCCASELTSPKLHSIMNEIKNNCSELIYGGGKGIGSQGDGTILFVTRGKTEQSLLINYLEQNCNLKETTFSLTIPSFDPNIKTTPLIPSLIPPLVRTAIIPVAGLGTRLQPATFVTRKEFLPILDCDGLVKPAIFILLEELNKSGIEKIILIVREGDEIDFKSKFSLPLHLPANDNMKKYMSYIHLISQSIIYVVQKNQEGFGHAVLQAKSYVQGEPTLLLLGDHLFKSNINIRGSNINLTCTKQAIDAFSRSNNKTTVLIEKVELEEVIHYGILSGDFFDKLSSDNDNDVVSSDHMFGRLMNVTRIIEKPSVEKARELLGINVNNKIEYYCIFGIYVLTSSVFDQLEEDVKQNKRQNGEFQLTSALESVLNSEGMVALVPHGKRFDIGLPHQYASTMYHYSKWPNRD